MRTIKAACVLLLGAALVGAWLSHPGALAQSFGIIVGTSPVSGGTSGQCLYNNSGVVGAQSCGGSSGLTIGTSTITSGTTNQLIYDNASVVGEITKCNSGVYITSGAGAPSCATTLPSGLTVPGPTVSGTANFSGTFQVGGNTMTFPGSSATIAGLGTNQTFSGSNTFSGTLNITGTGQINGTAFGTFATQNFATPPAIGGTTPAAGSFTTLTATTPLGLSSGGNNASTAAGARASGGLNIDELTSHGDSNYSIAVTDRVVGTSATLTAPRTWTLPTASSVNSGQTLIVQDFKGFVSNTNTLTLARNGSDTINGGTGSLVINNANGGFLLISDGVSNWSGQALGAQAAAGVASINGQTGNPNIVAGNGMAVTTSGGNISVAVNNGGGVVATSSGTFIQQMNPGGRLTLTSGVPITTSDVTGAAVVYYAPLTSPWVPIYNGTAMQLYQFTSSTTDTVGQTVTLGSNWASGSAYDWFIGLNSSTVTLCSGPAWSSASAGSSSRGTGAGTTELQLYNGVWTNKNSMTCRYGNATTFTCAVNQCTYVGSSLMTGAGATEDSAAKRYTYNLYNQAPRKLKNANETTNNWAYTTATYRQANANAANQLAVFVGQPGNMADIRLDAQSDTTGGAFPVVGIGINSSTTDSADTKFSGTCSNKCATWATLKTYPGIGLQQYLWIETASVASGTDTYYGQQVTGGIVVWQSGLTGTLWQ